MITAARSRAMRVLLLSMPFAALERPSLGLGLLKSALREAGFDCDVRYLGFPFAEFIGYEAYQLLHGGLPYTAFAGDWLFTRSLYGDRPEADAAYLETVLRDTWQLDPDRITRIVALRAYCEPFLDHCMETLSLADYDIVGFTSTFEQNLASLALARRIKMAFPDKVIAFGGANWEGVMGEALHETFGFVDYVCSGEADVSFPALVRSLAAYGDGSGIPGVTCRVGHATVTAPPAPPIADLDTLPIPDFADYLDAVMSSPAAVDVTPTLMLETSRGCWWGAKHHCTFCGLNGLTMAFRSKSADRVIAELETLRETYGVQSVSVVDNILDMRYFATLLPMLAALPYRYALFYEVKANLTRERVGQLAEAGITHIQPGIESLSDHVLALMNKGTTALQNVQLLKWCREYGIQPEWNLLYGFPGETPDDYAAMLPLVDAIDFLNPPTAHGPVRLDQFSPYHDDPGRHGIVRVRPQVPYRFLYPDDERLGRIAYYFDFEYADGRDPMSYCRPLLARVRAWMDRGAAGGVWILNATVNDATIMREDAGGARSVTRLSGWEARVYQECDRVQGRARLGEIAAEAGAVAGLDGFLDRCIRDRLMVRVDDRYLALGVHRPPLPIAPFDTPAEQPARPGRTELQLVALP